MCEYCCNSDDVESIVDTECCFEDCNAGLGAAATIFTGNTNKLNIEVTLMGRIVIDYDVKIDYCPKCGRKL